MVASSCCGAGAGLASGADLVLLGISDEVTSDLALIEDICVATGGPVVVNMSFGLVWEDVTSASEQRDIMASMRDLNAVMAQMKVRHPQLLFVLASGNEDTNMCDANGVVNYTDCANCMAWPQFGLGPPYGVADKPFVNVGATQVFPTAPHRRVAGYSNFGACVDVYAHGGHYCNLDVAVGRYRATQGTSFSAAMFSGMAALVFSHSGNRMTAQEVTEFLVTRTEDEVVHNSETTATSHNAFQVLPPEVVAIGLDPAKSSTLHLLPKGGVGVQVEIADWALVYTVLVLLMVGVVVAVVVLTRRK